MAAFRVGEMYNAVTESAVFTESCVLGWNTEAEMQQQQQPRTIIYRALGTQ